MSAATHLTWRRAACAAAAVLALSSVLVARPALAANNGSISGVVTDAKLHLAIDGLCVDAKSAPNTGYYTGSARTDSNGSYTITNLPTGDYYVIFGQCSQTWAMRFYPGTYDTGKAKPVHVDSGHNAGGINAQMERYGTVSGHVTGTTDGAPLPNVCIDLSSADSPAGVFVRRVATNQQGQFTSEEVTPGNWIVLLEGCGPDVPVAPTVYSSSGSRSRPTVVHVGDGEAVTGINAAMPRDGRITGRVVDRQGQPVSNVLVMLQLDYGAKHDYYQISYSPRTDARGRYRFTQMPGGHYRVLFGPQGHPRSYYRNVTTYAAATVVHVRVAETNHLREQTLRPR